MDAKQIIAESFSQIAEDILSGNYAPKVKIALTTIASEHGEDLWEKVVAQVNSKEFELVLIGKSVGCFQHYPADTLEEAHKIMNQLFADGKIDGAVTLHYDFPIGTSTVGKVITPAFGKDMFLATTTGTSAFKRVEAMVKNTIIGISTAKANGIAKPSVGILNIEGARQVEKLLKKLKANGYDINFADSARADGGCVMRGNDLLMATPDVMVCDSLTGNLLIKVFSSFNSGGNYETMGAGYGPGLPTSGEEDTNLINIISRASGAPQIVQALRFCANSASNKIMDINKAEFEKAQQAGLDTLFCEESASDKTQAEAIKMPAKEIVTSQISGIDILEIEDACQKLWKENIYAETGMGCTGPIILVTEANIARAKKILDIQA
jgi:hypothetical protein